MPNQQWHDIPPTVQFSPIAEYIWRNKYQYQASGTSSGIRSDNSIEDTWERVAKAVANAEPGNQASIDLYNRFYSLLSDFKFLPGGRILANAGTKRTGTTMFNCFVMGTIPDSMEGIFEIVKESALTQKQGGGVGFDFSTIRPAGSHIAGVESSASGPISFMYVLDATCRTIMSAGQRRGAQMGVLRCDHPDIEAFIDAKRDDNALRMFNLSVVITDAFMTAVRKNEDWDLVFNEKVYKTVKAKELWDKIMRSTYDYAEPGVLFIDRISEMNNLWYREVISATNPCGEQPLPPYGTCVLGSINLTKFVVNPFDDGAYVDTVLLEKCVADAVEFLDRTIDISNFPLEKQKAETTSTRRIGLGITGLADTLIMLKLKYGSEDARIAVNKIMETLTSQAYRTSIQLASKDVIGCNSFPVLNSEQYCASKFICGLPSPISKRILSDGIRNSHLVSIAPTGTISMLAGNVSSGIEPVFAFTYKRKIMNGKETDTTEHEVMDYAYAKYCEMFGRPETLDDLPDYFVTTDKVTPEEHILMQATVQRWVDSAISKTVNVPTDISYDDFKNVYDMAFDYGLKGCTTFRPNTNIAGILIRPEDEKAKTDEPEPVNVPSESITSRPEELHGTTYKIKTPVTKNAFYVTINDIVEHGVRRPYEIFINTKNLQHYSWVVSITRLISAILRREKDSSFLIEELTSIHDPNGGYYNNGQYIPSLPAEIGKLIERHIDKLKSEKTDPTNGFTNATFVTELSKTFVNSMTFVDLSKTFQGTNVCSFCGSTDIHMQDGCQVCSNCGSSKCG